MRLNSNRLTRRNGRHPFEKKMLGAGLLALTLCLIVAAPNCFAQGSNPAPSDTATGAMPNDAPAPFRRKARFSEMQAVDSGDADTDMMRRQRMRKAILRGRQMNAADANGESPEAFNRGPNNFGGAMGRKARGGFMSDGPGGGRRGFGGRGGFPGGKRALDLTALNLTEEQKGKIQQLRSRTSTRARELRRKLMSGGQELRDMMFDPAASDETIRAKGRELRRLHEQVEDIKLDDFLSIRSVLTAEQRKHLPEVKPGGPRAAMAGANGRGNPGDMPPPPDGDRSFNE
jgi:Spy/CpxP family protein refolding chaperone